MAQNRQRSAPSRVPRPVPNLDMDNTYLSSTQVDPNSKSRHVRWTDTMDECLVNSLLHQLVGSHKRSDNGFTTFQISKAIEAVDNGCQVVVSDKNDANNGRVTVDALAWEELLKTKSEYGRWRSGNITCPRYDDYEAIFGNDTATGERSVIGDFSPVHVKIQVFIDDNVDAANDQNDEIDPSPTHDHKRKAKRGEKGATKARRQRTQSIDESYSALLSIAKSSKKIANAMEIQASLDTLSHINWQLVLEKLQRMNMEKSDILEVMKIFQADESLTKVFISLTDDEFMHELVYEKLGRAPPPQV